MQRLLFILAGFTTFCLAACRTQEPERKSHSGRSGQALYASYCAGCHGQDGRGNMLNLGPSLAGLRSHWKAETLDAFLVNPRAYAPKDPRLGKREMPALAADVTPAERAELVTYTLQLMD